MNSTFNTTHDEEYTTVGIACRSTVVLFVSVAIILGNLINFFILRATKQMSPVANIFLTNLTTSDFCGGLIACLPSIYPAITGTWPYGAIWCQVSAIAHGSCCAVSMWSVGVIGIERYLATCHPLFYKHKITPRTCVVIISFLWIFGILMYLTPNMTKADFLYYIYQPKFSMCSLYNEAKLLSIATHFMVPFLSGSVVTFTTASIAITLKQTNPGASLPATTERRRERRWRRRDKKAVLLLMVTMGLLFATWGPFSMMTFLNVSGVDVDYPDWLAFTLIWIGNSNFFVNVIIYSAIYPSFRTLFKKLLYMIFCCGCFRSGSRVEPWTSPKNSETHRDRY